MPDAAAARKSAFISHISDETEVAQWLKGRLDGDFLGALDIFVSSDRESIGAGQRWLDQVDAALTRASLEVVLCSSESVGRPWVNFEAGAAWLRGIPIVPVCHSGLRPDDLPPPLSLLQGIAIDDPAGLAKLYDTVAGAVGLRTPAVDFTAIAAEARALEVAYADRPVRMERVENPRVLCAASEQYGHPSYGFDLDVAVVEKHFPGRVTVERSLTSERLMDLLTGERFDIVHLVMMVDRDRGDLVFGAGDEGTGHAAPGADVMRPMAFASLVAETGARLVVLATCYALSLAADVVDVANMAASNREVSGEEAAAWEDTFYRLVAQGKSVHRAFDITRQQRDTPIQTLKHTDVVFALRG